MVMYTVKCQYKDVGSNKFKLNYIQIYNEKDIDTYLNDSQEFIKVSSFCSKFKIKAKTLFSDLIKLNQYDNFIIVKQEVNRTGVTRDIKYLTSEALNFLMDYYRLDESLKFNGFIYFVAHKGLDSIVKIGMTYDLKNRMQGFLTHSPLGINFIHQIPVCNVYHVESVIHNRLSYLNTRGEWFDFSKVEVVDLIKSLDDEFNIRKNEFS